MNAQTNTFYAEVPSLGNAEKQEIIDAMYAELTLPAACQKTGYDLRRVMNALDNDSEFLNAMAIAESHLAAYGEEELKRRAIRGIDTPVVANGKVVYVVQDGTRRPLIETKYSDSLLKLYLEANKREKYGAKVDVTTTHKGHIALPIMSLEMIDLMFAMQRGDNIELIADQSYKGDGYEVIDAEFEEVTDDPVQDDSDAEAEFDLI